MRGFNLAGKHVNRELTAMGRGRGEGVALPVRVLIKRHSIEVSAESIRNVSVRKKW